MHCIPAKINSIEMDNEISIKKIETNGARWFAITTKYKHEKKVNKLLLGKGHECYLPLYNKLSYWKDRKKKIPTPLFNCYLFVNIDIKTKMDILQTDGVLHFVSFENHPVPIPNDQIETIKNILKENRKIESHHTYTKGQKVKVLAGALKGVEGYYQKKKDQSRLLIALETLNQMIAVEINADEVAPIA